MKINCFINFDVDKCPTMETVLRGLNEPAWPIGVVGFGDETDRRESRTVKLPRNSFARNRKIAGTLKFFHGRVMSTTEAPRDNEITRNSCVTHDNSCIEFVTLKSLESIGTATSFVKTCGFTTTTSGRGLSGIGLPRIAIIVFLFLCLLFHTTRPTSAAFTTVSTVPDPEFVDEIGNITVPAGRNVKLACSVKDLGSYKVAWMLFDKSAILTVHTHVITRNPRISVTHDKHRTWYLHINNVQEDDKGKYMCQINTATAKTHYGYLHVVVPPNIDDSLSSSDAIVRENANVTLTCKASGSPPPTIRWKRDDNAKIAINKSLEVTEWEGETLEMVKISRLGMGAYLCIASNGIPPTVSKQIKVSVDFSPMLSIPHQLVGAPVNYSVTLECHTEAHPTSLNYWTRGDSGIMIHDSPKYKTTTTPEKPSYKTHMTLTIYNIQIEDYGGYKCVAKNPRGSTDGTIRLYTSTPPSTSPSPITTDLSRKASDGLEMNNSIDGNPSSLTVHNDKDSKQGKSGSHLNEIDKSEQKSDQDGKGIYWPPETDSSSAYATAGSLLIFGIISTWIIR